jgi:predicted nucleic acid-binding protein
MAMKYLLDTNIFNRVLDDKFSLSTLPAGSSFFATKVQLEELRKTPDPIRRAALIKAFNDIAPELLSPAFAFDIAGAGLDEGSFRQDDRAAKLHADLEKIKSKFNNWHDALIAEVALLHGYILITTDRTLARVAERHGLSVHLVAT